ncbi:MAG: aldose 1-epimerase [Flavobacteriaceae bacterium]
MYSINYDNDQNGNLKTVVLSNENQSDFAEIAINLGSSLQNLKLSNKQIIKSLEPLTYSNTYASSVLFPFANRIQDGTYKFNGETFSFPINEPDRNNALHGLVYSKTFRVVDEKTSEKKASITLLYEETKLSKGFPYSYSIQLKYTLKSGSLDLQVLIKNTDTKTFPFTTGWHPYFYSSDLHNSSLNFVSDTQLVFNDRCITTDTAEVSNTSNFEIKDKQLDDCFILKNNEVQFNTPDYNLLISSSEDHSFLQIYTPPKKDAIAIEPTTGVSDSFNNKMGLKTLSPNDSYQITWNLKLI